MRDDFSRDYNSVSGGLTAMRADENIWSNHPAIVAKVEAGEEILEKIEDFAMDAMSDSKPISALKKVKKKVAAELALAIASPIETFAEDNNNAELAGEMGMTRSELLFAKDVDAVDRWKLVLKRANDNLQALITGGYPVTQDIVTDLSNAIDNFVQTADAPRIKRASKKGANEQLKDKIKELKKVSNQIQKLISPFALTERSFYATVIDAFNTDNTGVRHWAIRITFLDKETGVRLKNVKTSIKEKPELSRKSTISGVVIFKTAELEDGNYSLLVELKDYTSQKFANIKAEHGKLTRLEVLMEKTA